MERYKALLFLHAFLLLWVPLAKADRGADDRRPGVQTYIVHVQKPKNLVLGSPRERENWHRSFLPSLALDSGLPRLVYSYEHAIGGFAARLTPEEVEAVEAMDGVLFAQPDAELTTRTTHSPKFLGLTRSDQLWDYADRGEGTIIGVIESGFYSEHESFSEEDMPPQPPGRWRGACTFQPERCNGKLIGNRIFNSSGNYNPNREYAHGTHVASTAAGSPMKGVSFVGEACGTASGTAPRAHLAFYSVNYMSDSLMAVDKAIEDGVDVLSISIGLKRAVPFYHNSIDIGALSATKNGIFVSVAAGNDGPEKQTVLDNAPWTLSVGASTTDRVTRVEIRLGDGGVVQAETANAEIDFFPVGASLPAVFPGNLTGKFRVSYCDDSNFGGVDVSEKVVLCVQGRIKKMKSDPTAKTCKVRSAGGKALILMNEWRPGSTMYYYLDCVIPTVLVNHEEAQKLRAYMASDPNPTLSFEPKGTIYGVRRHPAVADFSARGPSPVNNGVLKPDILGPGVNILGANPGSTTHFFYMSGTSMACPHLSGIAAMLKGMHPGWSPAMIKSAIMTTSDWQDNTGMPIADETGAPASLFATGAGQVNATRAADPGLVYDMPYSDYVAYVCGLEYTPDEVNAVLRDTVDCDVEGFITGEDLNYPSFFVEASSTPKEIFRTVRNVGRSRENYTLSLDQPPDVWIDVFPRKLDFHPAAEELTYTLTIVSTNPQRVKGNVVEGQLTWVSPYHTVRSPIAISFAEPEP